MAWVTCMARITAVLVILRRNTGQGGGRDLWGQPTTPPVTDRVVIMPATKKNDWTAWKGLAWERISWDAARGRDSLGCMRSTKS